MRYNPAQVRCQLLQQWRVLGTQVLADDSNFRERAMDAAAEPLAAVLALPAGRFQAAWCAGA